MAALLRWVARGAGGLGLLAALGTGVIAFAHTSAGRPLLAYLPGIGGHCPVGFDATLTAEQRDELRQDVLAREAGTSPAAARPALGFALGTTSRQDAVAWAASSGVACEDGRAGELWCDHVPACAIGGVHDVDDVLLTFDAGGRLVSVDASFSAPADEAAPVYALLAQSVAREAGPPARERGRGDAGYLDAGPMSQAATSFRFADYRADVTATNLGRGRIVVRTTFQAV